MTTIRDNKLLRAQLRAKSQNTTGESLPTIDEHLLRLEEEIRRLKVEFDIFFNGASKRPPYDSKARVETSFKRLGDDRTLTYAQRYRVNSLAGRFNAFRDLWRRTLQGREAGTDPASAARASAKQMASEEFKVTTFVCADATKEVEVVKGLYGALLEAKKVCGEPTEDFSFPRFHRLIASKADKLRKQFDCDRVSFSVDVEGGHVSFRAKAEKD